MVHSPGRSRHGPQTARGRGQTGAAGIDFAVAPLPSVGGRPPGPCRRHLVRDQRRLAQQGTSRSNCSRTTLLTDDNLAIWNANNSVGALAGYPAAAKQTDPNASRVTIANASSGIPMPSNPEMGASVGHGPGALQHHLKAQDVKPALDDAAKRIPRWRQVSSNVRRGFCPAASFVVAEGEVADTAPRSGIGSARATRAFKAVGLAAVAAAIAIGMWAF